MTCYSNITIDFHYYLCILLEGNRHGIIILYCLELRFNWMKWNTNDHFLIYTCGRVLTLILLHSFSEFINFVICPVYHHNEINNHFFAVTTTWRLSLKCLEQNDITTFVTSDHWSSQNDILTSHLIPIKNSHASKYVVVIYIYDLINSIVYVIVFDATRCKMYKTREWNTLPNFASVKSNDIHMFHWNT